MFDQAFKYTFGSYRIVIYWHCIKSVLIRSFSGPYFLAFSPIAGKYGPEKLQIRTLFTQCITFLKIYSFQIRLSETESGFQFLVDQLPQKITHSCVLPELWVILSENRLNAGCFLLCNLSYSLQKRNTIWRISEKLFN